MYERALPLLDDRQWMRRTALTELPWGPKTQGESECSGGRHRSRLCGGKGGRGGGFGKQRCIEADIPYMFHIQAGLMLTAAADALPAARLISQGGWGTCGKRGAVSGGHK